MKLSLVTVELKTIHLFLYTIIDLKKINIIYYNDKKMYMGRKGNLQWIVSIDRIGIFYAVNEISRLNQCPRGDHLKHVTSIFYYLRKYSNKSIKICFLNK